MKERLDQLLDALCFDDMRKIMHDLWWSLTYGLRRSYPTSYEPKPRFIYGTKPAWHDYTMTAERIGTSSACLAAAGFPLFLV